MSLTDTKLVIFAGGLGTRLGELTREVPKPMLEVEGKPLIYHLMATFASYGFKKFLILAGYQSNVIKNYFNNLTINSSSEVTFDFGSGEVKASNAVDWEVEIFETPTHFETGERLFAARDKLTTPFFLTYGDGLADIDFQELLNFHLRGESVGTITSIHPTSRFGHLVVSGEKVESFREKPILSEVFVSGGFFVFSPEIFDYMEPDCGALEGQTLRNLADNGLLRHRLHEGFWQSVDTKRDLDLVRSIAASKGAPWVKS